MRSTWGGSRSVLYALLAALLFGASTPLAKGLLADAPPQILAGLFYCGSGLGLGAIWLVRRRSGSASDAALTRGDLPWMLGAIAFGGLLGPLLLLAGLTHTPASAASLLLNLEGVLTALLAWVVFRENVDRRIVLGMVAIVAGGALLTWQGRLEWGGLSGPLLIAAACLCWAIDNNLTQKVSASDPLQIAALKGGVAGTVNLGLGLMLGGAAPAAPTIGVALLLGFFGYGLSLVLFVLALRGLGTARTGAYFSTAPFVGATLSVILWQEPVTGTLLLAGGLMAFGVWLHVSERHEHGHSHIVTVHDHRHTHDAHHQHAQSPADPADEPHSHAHEHAPLVHIHPHYPDIHHRHEHG